MTSRIVGVVLLGVTALGCSTGAGTDSKAAEERGREIQKKMEASIPKTQQIALAQKADAAVVKRVQEELGLLKEYLDEPTGKLDFVTVNAVEAFQRHVGLKDDGLLDEETVKRLDEEAAKAREGKSGYWSASG